MPDYDAIADKVHGGVTVRLEDLLAELAGAPIDAIENAMRLRGVTVDGSMLRPTDQMPDFAQAALMAVELQGRPMMADEIIAATRLPDTAIPLLTISSALEEAGLSLLPGVGWWTDRVWKDEAGEAFYKRTRSKHGMAVLRLFVRHGWPLHAAEIERLTGGDVRAKALENRADIFGGIANVGLRMYAPETEAERYVVPMSRGLAKDLLHTHPDKPILRTRHYTRFMVALLMGRARWAVLKRGTTQKDGPRTACLRVRLTPTGEAMLTQMSAGRRATIPDLV